VHRAVTTPASPAAAGARARRAKHTVVCPAPTQVLGVVHRVVAECLGHLQLLAHIVCEDILRAAKVPAAASAQVAHELKAVMQAVAGVCVCVFSCVCVCVCVFMRVRARVGVCVCGA